MNKDKSIKDLKQYNDKLKNQFEYSKIRVWNLERENERLQQELQRKDNIINELKKHLEYEIAEWQDVDNILTKASVEEDKDILDKIKELEENK